MVVTKRSKNRVQLESDKYQAAVRLTWDKEAKTWLLTMFEKKNSVPDNTTDTVETLASNGNDTATPENTVVSFEGKGSEFASDKQEEGRKSYPDIETSYTSRSGKTVHGRYGVKINGELPSEGGGVHKQRGQVILFSFFLAV